MVLLLQLISKFNKPQWNLSISTKISVPQQTVTKLNLKSLIQRQFWLCGLGTCLQANSCGKSVNVITNYITLSQQQKAVRFIACPRKPESDFKSYSIWLSTWTERQILYYDRRRIAQVPVHTVHCVVLHFRQKSGQVRYQVQLLPGLALFLKPIVNFGSL